MFKQPQQRRAGAPQEVAPVPTFGESQPMWQRLSDRVGELSRRRDDIHLELNDLEQATALDNSIIWRDRTGKNIQMPTPPSRKKSLNDRVKAMLAGFEPPTAPKPPEPTEPVVTYHDPFTARKAELSKELTDIHQALDLLLPQLGRAHQSASLAFCHDTMPAYREHAARIGRALLELGAACQAERDFLKGAQSQGCDPEFYRPTGVGQIVGDVAVGMPLLREVLDRAVSNGHLDQAELDALPSLTPVAYVQPPPPPTPHADKVRLGLRLRMRRSRAA